MLTTQAELFIWPFPLRRANRATSELREERTKLQHRKANQAREQKEFTKLVKSTKPTSSLIIPRLDMFLLLLLSPSFGCISLAWLDNSNSHSNNNSNSKLANLPRGSSGIVCVTERQVNLRLSLSTLFYFTLLYFYLLVWSFQLLFISYIHYNKPFFLLLLLLFRSIIFHLAVFVTLVIFQASI